MIGMEIRKSVARIDGGNLSSSPKLHSRGTEKASLVTPTTPTASHLLNLGLGGLHFTFNGE